MQSKGLSRVFSNTTVQKHQFFGANRYYKLMRHFIFFLPTEPRGKPMTNLDSILKSRYIILPTKVHIVKAMVFPVVIFDVRVGL